MPNIPALERPPQQEATEARLNPSDLSVTIRRGKREESNGLFLLCREAKDLELPNRCVRAVHVQRVHHPWEALGPVPQIDCRRLEQACTVSPWSDLFPALSRAAWVQQRIGWLLQPTQNLRQPAQNLRQPAGNLQEPHEGLPGTNVVRSPEVVLISS